MCQVRTWLHNATNIGFTNYINSKFPAKTIYMVFIFFLQKYKSPRKFNTKEIKRHKNGPGKESVCQFYIKTKKKHNFFGKDKIFPRDLEGYCKCK